jgi:chromate transporter
VATSSQLFQSRWKELAAVFLKLGAMSYGGSAMLGIMQAEIAERRQWLTNEHYLDGVGLVTMLPGPPAVQLAIFIGYNRCGWRGGILAGLCFMLPAFLILLGLTLTYSTYGAIGLVQGALYGMGSVVLAIFAAAVYRLGRTALKRPAQIVIAIVAAIFAAKTSIGIATTLLIAACAGVALYHSRLQGLAAALAVVSAAALSQFLFPITDTASTHSIIASPDGTSSSILQLAGIFLKIGALTFGGGIAMLALIQEQVVDQMHWLSSREFLDGLSLGQLTPGPTLMIAAYVGYKVAGITGAAVSGLAMFLPAFILMLSLLPVLERFRHLLWIKPAMNGVSAAVIGCLIVTLLQLLPHAAPDTISLVALLITAIVLCRWRLPPLPLIVAAGLVGIVIQATH